MTIEERKEPKTCIWIHGKPGTGKTRFAVTTYPNAYRKLHNKWWDSFQGQEAVIVDDLGIEAKTWIATFLKQWADPWYNHPGEVKGGQVALNYNTFVVTSNYHPSELFCGVDYEAIMRRFEVRELQ